MSTIPDQAQTVAIQAKQIMYLWIVPDQPMHYDEYRKGVIYYLQHFLSLATDSSVLPVILKGRNRHFIQKYDDGEKVQRNIIIYEMPSEVKAEDRGQFEVWRLLFSYSDIRENFQEILQSWFNKAEKLRPVFDLYFGLFYIPHGYAHLRFLTLAQALETYHRRMHGGEYISSEDYKLILPRLESAIKAEIAQEDLQINVAGKLKHGHEYSLRKRLRHLLNTVLVHHQEAINRLIGTQKRFISEFVDTRNYLTHYDEKGDAITDTEKLHEFVYKLQRLLQICFLIELGFPTEKINALIAKNWWGKH